MSKKGAKFASKNVEIAAEYKIGESTVSEILKSKDRWLAVDESIQANAKRERKSYRRIVGKSIATKKQTCLEGFINLKFNRETGWNVQK